jgi:hypothetical protein
MLNCGQTTAVAVALTLLTAAHHSGATAAVTGGAMRSIVLWLGGGCVGAAVACAAAGLG